MILMIVQTFYMKIVMQRLQGVIVPVIIFKVLPSKTLEQAIMILVMLIYVLYQILGMIVIVLMEAL